MNGKSILFLLCLTLISSCAHKNFFQKDARYLPTAAEVKQGLYAELPQDSVWAAAGRHYDHGWFFRFVWGDHYRDVWKQPVKAKVIELDTTAGGLTPDEMGGGFQSTSLRLKNKKGSTYVIRSLDKNPQRVLPPFLRNTFLMNWVRDQTSAGNPYGAFTIPPLAEAAGIFHTNPRLVYVPYGLPVFSEYDTLLGGRLFLLEEKFNNKASLTPAFGKAIDLEDSEDILRDRFADNRNRIDQQLFARSRLFDIWVGDWDRHQGQWQWAVYKQNDGLLFKPIPMDRDQVFYRFDGLLPGLVNNFGNARKFVTFDKKLKKVEPYTINAQFIDRVALNELTREQFRAIAANMQAALTDAVIDSAIQIMPPEAYKLEGPFTAEALKSRRSELQRVADELYLLKAKHVEVAGSDKKEMFVVKRLEKGITSVTVHREAKEKGTTGDTIYHRTFYPNETKSITLHGLGDEDEFLVEGKARKGIKVIIVGGGGEDKVTDTSRVSGLGRKTHVRDTWRGVEVEGGKETKVTKSRNVSIIAFDREGI